MTLEARSTLACLHANGNIDDPFVQAQVEDMKVEIGIDATGRRTPIIVGNVVSGLSFVVGSVLMARWPGSVDNLFMT